MGNAAVISCPDASANCRPGPPLQVPQIGTIVFSKAADGKITGHTDQGCSWTFAVRAHVLGDASAGRHQASVMAGTDEQGGDFLLGVGSLTKR
jgi:hypothetical protein